jgi:RNA polymerase sigma-70 factor (ECF subfamily)
MEVPDPRAFLEAYDQHADALYRFCYAQTGRTELARDLVQDAFARTWRHLADGKPIHEWRPFLYRVARNTVTDYFRKHREESLDQLMDKGFDAAASGPQADALAEASRAVALIGRLPLPYREVLTLRYTEELGPKEIAGIMGESENAVSVRIHRGLQMLRSLMGISS